jgi:hypothetical protein
MYVGITAPHLSRLSLVRRGRNEALCRCGVQRRDEELAFRCECDAADCAETLVLTRGDYDYVRRHADFLIVVPGHESPAARVEEQLAGGLIVQVDA